jgi:hypothetical protein
MPSIYFDQTVGIRKLKRAEATLLGRRSGDLSNLQRSELIEYTWAFSTIVVAAQQGLRLAPGVVALAESVAHSRISAVAEPGAESHLSCPFPAVSGVD